MKYNLTATCRLGLESVLKDELHKLNCQYLDVKNGEINFEGNEKTIVNCNLWLRTAERVLLKLAVFPATTFDGLFEVVSQIKWGELLPNNAKIVIVDKCVESQLMSGRSVQSISKKAIAESLMKKYKVTWLSEDGAEFLIHVDVIKDIVTVSLDSSGAGLHKRGYRAQAGEAPLRETIASAMIMLSNWNPAKPLYDPFCGSGTILIEAALMAQNIAPGISRAFAAQDWPFIDKQLWMDARKDALSKRKSGECDISGSDIDEDMIRLAQANAKKAGVGFIKFRQMDFENFEFSSKSGTVITNPPYGERISDIQSAEKIIGSLGEKLQKKASWSYFILSSHEDFERIFGRKANKKRKIYNGKIRCYDYSYL